MDYIFCSVLWRSGDGGARAPSLIAAARLDDSGNILGSRDFASDDSTQLLRDFAAWCGSGYMLCLWEGSSAGRIKKLFSAIGMNHPYEHLYHLSGIFELTLKKCTDKAARRRMQSAREHKPVRYGKKNSAAAELKWMCGIFPLLDFSAADKSHALPFTEQPSNKYFVFRNGKCFHTKDCSMVKSAAVSSLRAYTYYSTVTDAGFTPCSRCKPADTDEQTAEEMRILNRERLTEAHSRNMKNGAPVKPRYRRPMTVFRSLEHMCGMYGIGYRKSGDRVYISTPSDSWYIIPESSSIELYRLCPDGEYRIEEKGFSDPYEAVRKIIKNDEEKQSK